MAFGALEKLIIIYQQSGLSVSKFAQIIGKDRRTLTSWIDKSVSTYISNKLNIIKFLPMQVKHIAYKNGENKIEMIFNPFDSIEINKKEPVFLVVEAMHSQ